MAIAIATFSLCADDTDIAYAAHSQNLSEDLALVDVALHWVVVVVLYPGFLDRIVVCGIPDQFTCTDEKIVFDCGEYEPKL